MSAFMVSDLHIDHIVTAIIHGELTAKSPDEIGRMLWRECLSSVAFRYPDDNDGERPSPVGLRESDIDSYTWHRTGPLDKGVLMSTLSSYRYQSCQHPEWDGSEANMLVLKLLDPLELAGVEMQEDKNGFGWSWPSRKYQPKAGI